MIFTLKKRTDFFKRGFHPLNKCDLKHKKNVFLIFVYILTYHIYKAY